MRQTYTILLGIFFVYLSALPFEVVHAQEGVLLEAPKPLDDIRLLRREPDSETFKPVFERTPSDLLAVPLRWRGFKIYPILTTSQLVDTNIFATDSTQEVDTVTILKPAIFVNKDFGRHQANFSIESEGKKYWSNADEDVFNFSTSVSGFLEARREFKIPFELTYASGHETRAQNLAPNFSKEPIAYSSLGSAFGISYEPNRLSSAAILRYVDLSFDNGENKLGQTIVREDANRSLTMLELNNSYQILPNHRPFVNFTYGFTDYENKTYTGSGFNGIERDSTNANFLAGWESAYKGLVEGYLGFGFGVRNYDDPALEDISSSKLSGNINWNITKRATLSLGLKRAITEDNQILQGAILSQGRAKMDYEFLHNLFYNAFIDYSLADFQGSTREDNILSIGTGFRYVLSPRFSVNGDYNFKTRESTASGFDYDRHQFMLSLKTRF